MSSQKYKIGSSIIHGQGVIAAHDIRAGDIIDIGIDYHYGLFPYVTPYFGSWLNHCQHANSKLAYLLNKYYVMAIIDIRRGTEITINYDHTPWYIEGSKPKYKPC